MSEASELVALLMSGPFDPNSAAQRPCERLEVARKVGTHAQCSRHGGSWSEAGCSWAVERAEQVEDFSARQRNEAYGRGYGIARAHWKSRADAAEAERDRLRDEVNGFRMMKWPEEAHRLKQQRDALRAQVERVEALADEWESATGVGLGLSISTTYAANAIRTMLAASSEPVTATGPERAEAFIELLPPDVGHNLRHFGPGVAHVTGHECHCQPERIEHAPAGERNPCGHDYHDCTHGTGEDEPVTAGEGERTGDASATWLWHHSQNVNFMRLQIRDKWPALAKALNDWQDVPAGEVTPPAEQRAARHHHSRSADWCDHHSGDCCVECCEPGGAHEEASR